MWRCSKSLKLRLTVNSKVITLIFIVVIAMNITFVSYGIHNVVIKCNLIYCRFFGYLYWVSSR